MRLITRLLGFMFTLALVVGGIVFGNENSDKIQIVLFGQATGFYPKWYILIMAAGFGALLTLVFFIVEFVVLFSSRRSALTKIKKLEKREEKKEEEIVDLKNEIVRLQNICQANQVAFDNNNVALQISPKHE